VTLNLPKSPPLPSDELDQLYERLKHHVEIVDDTQGVSTVDMEKIVQESHQQVQQVRQEMKDSVAQLANSIDDLNAAVK
jgi:adenylosuccinate synthase